MNYKKNLEKAIDDEFGENEMLGEVLKANLLYQDNDEKRHQILDDIKESYTFFEKEILSQFKYTYDSSGNTILIKDSPNIPLYIKDITNNDGTDREENL